MQIKAKIIDENNEPLVGAHVVLLNQNGTATTVGDYSDFDGNFYINNALIGNSSLLLVSYVGYKKITIPVASILVNKGIIQLFPDSAMLPETTVYGQKKSSFNWWFLLAIPVGYAIYKATQKKPKKVTL